jgi:hypothetical protein
MLGTYFCGCFLLQALQAAIPALGDAALGSSLGSFNAYVSRSSSDAVSKTASSNKVLT